MHRRRAWRSLPDSRELVFFQAMHGFHVALVGVGGSVAGVSWDGGVGGVAPGVMVGMRVGRGVPEGGCMGFHCTLRVYWPADPL